MNKYQKALNLVIKVVEMDNGCAGIFFKYNSEMFEAIDVLKELVEKATPKKAIKSDVQDIRYITKYECPNCGGNFTGKLLDYCYHCGQAIDWSDEES